MPSQTHPLPPPPVQRPTQHRTKSSFSFRSTNSHKSSGSVPKIDLHETHEEKQARRLHSKADPSIAMNEAEPSEVANQENKLPSIRDLQHFDKQGNPIADPDRSNPTRSRWERPLDTIRAFEEAIDGSYSRKSGMRNGNDSADAGSQFNRRNSYYAGSQAGQDDRPRFPQHSGAYGGGGRSQSYRPDSYVDGRSNGAMRPDSYYYSNDNSGHGNGPSYYNPNRARYPRTASEPHFNSGHGVYPGPGNQHSYETVTTASGSGSSPDTVGYSTDPSSENSSVDRIVQPQHKEPVDNYGFNGFGGNPPIQPPGYNINEQHYGSNGAQQQGYAQPPPVPRKEAPNSRVPIKLGQGENGGSSTRLAASEKRKSWFGKRFSKSN